MAHYIENTGAGTLRYLKLFPSACHGDVSLAQGMAVTPHELVQARLNLAPKLLDALCKKAPVVPV